MNQDPGSACADMEATFLGAGLVAPPVPDALGDALRTKGRWTWATENPPFSLYAFFEPLLEFARSREVLAVGHAGHGVNSYAITYLLGLGPLVLGAQIPWGGAYQNAERTAADVAEGFGQIARLVELAEATPRTSRRLLVVHSGLIGGRSVGWVMDSEVLPQGWIAKNRIEEDEFELALHMLGDASTHEGGDHASQ